MESIVERLKNNCKRQSTNANYLAIWRKFNKFVIRLDVKPKYWEDRTTLFCGYLIENGIKSTTIRSYISAIKAILKLDGYEWNDNMVLLSALTRACRIVNDTVKTRLPIRLGLLEVILFELGRIFDKQVYLMVMYRAMFALAYYGLFRVGELTSGDHQIKACNVHSGTNKDKILIILYSSKTHGKESRPQTVKISARDSDVTSEINNKRTTKLRNFCPFQLTRDYIELRGPIDGEDEPFFIFQGKIAVKPIHMRTVLRHSLNVLGLDSTLYDTHSARIGRASDLMSAGLSIDRLKILGRWRSSCVFKYIRN